MWWDYKKEASYFITLCFKINKKIRRSCSIMNPNQLGLIVDDWLKEINSPRLNVTKSTYCIMPDHVHLILEFKNY
jgi:REP element-mobilizing transposase RayT